jgi:hypothetical protein
MVSAKNAQGAQKKKPRGKPFQPGNAGRRPGTQNKFTRALKDAILEAGELAGGEGDDNNPGGMVGYLKTLAEDNPAVFGSLLGRVLPLQIAGDKDNPLRTITEVRETIVDPGNSGPSGAETSSGAGQV